MKHIAPSPERHAYHAGPRDRRPDRRTHLPADNNILFQRSAPAATL